MNDMARSEDLGDLPPAAAPSKGKRGAGKAKAKKPAKAAKAKEAKAPSKRSTKTTTEVVAEFEQDQRVQAREGRNTQGIEGRENSIRAFIVDWRGLIGDKNKIISKMGVRAADAKNAGVPVKLVKQLLKELDKPEEAATMQNIMNQLRGLVSLPHGEPIDDMSTYEGDDTADARAYKAGRMHVWRGGRSQDNPYHGDVKRGQEWLRGFNDAYAEAEASSSAHAMKKLHALATEAAKSATA